jgi:hypothetical protein
VCRIRVLLIGWLGLSVCIVFWTQTFKAVVRVVFVRFSPIGCRSVQIIRTLSDMSAGHSRIWVVACSLRHLVIFIVVVVRVVVGYFFGLCGCCLYFWWLCYCCLGYSCLLSRGCKLDPVMKKIWLKLESKDPILVTVWQGSQLTACDLCKFRNWLFMATLLGKSCWVSVAQALPCWLTVCRWFFSPFRFELLWGWYL